MRRRVDAARETAYDRETGVGELIRKLLRAFQTVVRRLPRADNRDALVIAIRQAAPDVEHDRRVVNLAQQPGIPGRFLREDMRAEVGDALQFRFEIDVFFPARNRLGYFLPDAVNGAQFAGPRTENALRCPENFEQFSQPHRPHFWNHVQRNAGLGVRHAARLARRSNPKGMSF